ncbi:hypothetical protein [Desulfosarcina variabilis]|uniref:hypothetical protein n=1 Tax=Desulfosarcina variabilis TaxID=2300 RepID=UPI003AFB5D61
MTEAPVVNKVIYRAAEVDKNIQIRYRSQFIRRWGDHSLQLPQNLRFTQIFLLNGAASTTFAVMGSRLNQCNVCLRIPNLKFFFYKRAERFYIVPKLGDSNSGSHENG